MTGIRRRHWAADDERPSGMAFKAALEAIRKSEIATKDIDAIIVATTTPDAAMPSTACILQDRLSLPTIPAFDLNAACCGWLYAVSIARGMILSGMARNVLTVGVDLQSRLLDPSDRNAYFLFGDGAGGHHFRRHCRAIASASTILGADMPGHAHGPPRRPPGYAITNGHNGNGDSTPGSASTATPCSALPPRVLPTSFAGRSPRPAGRWKRPAGSFRTRPTAEFSTRPPSAAACDFQRFSLNVENLGNTSSASIPLTLIDVEESLRPGDKLILCSVGAGMTTAAISVEW